jgi:DNA polymerase-1
MEPPYIRLMPKKEGAKVLLLDGHSLAFRAFYALPQELRTQSGQQTNAVFGFTSMLIKALQEEKTNYIAVAFDRGRPVERLAIRPEYKATRVAPPDEFRQQLGLIREVLEVLRVPVFELDDVEADDILAILAQRLASIGNEVIIVTADRDFFQVVGDGVKVLMNRRGISETKLYDQEALIERYGFGSDRYLEYAALRGDTSDNIAGVVGVGEKTATKLVQEHGTLEKIYENLGGLTARVRGNLEEAKERLLENREFFRFRSAEELAQAGAEIPDLTLEEFRIGEWDFDQIRKLFDALEFRTLYERLTTELAEAPKAEGGFEAECFEVTDEKSLKSLIDRLKKEKSLVLRVGGPGQPGREPPGWIAFALRDGERSQAFTVRFDGLLDAAKTRKALKPVLESLPLITHGSKDALARLEVAGIDGVKVEMDTEIAAYLIDPARGTYGLDELAGQYLGRRLELELEGTQEAVDAGQQELALAEPAAEEPSPDVGLEAIATAELSEVMQRELQKRGAWDLFFDLELPLAAVLAKLESTGVKIDVPYLEKMSEAISDELRAIEEEIYRHSGEPFNINSPPQLRRVLYDELQLKPTKKTKTGFSTDATVLESLRDEHPIVDAILRYRERSKLKSTYIDALPPLVDPRTGRLHCRFNQTVTTTGRLSSDTPNLQNIPIRTEEGRQIRRAFIPEGGYLLLVADYSQIELRILAHLSKDEALTEVFRRGEDVHRKSIAKALGINEDEVSPQLRSVGKMVSYGVTYGMGPFGLSQRLRIPVDQARSYIEGFFATYPQIRDYLDSVVAQAAKDGFTTTLLGRRRYLPELHARNPRIRNLGERMALNAPIQGSAADIMKLAMVRCDETLEGSDARALLTVHDELVFEVPEAEVEETGGKVRDAMEHALVLSVPMEVDVAWGPNWSDAKKS